ERHVDLRAREGGRGKLHREHDVAVLVVGELGEVQIAVHAEEPPRELEGLRAVGLEEGDDGRDEPAVLQAEIDREGALRGDADGSERVLPHGTRVPPERVEVPSQLFFGQHRSTSRAEAAPDVKPGGSIEGVYPRLD